ncbi:MAG TPA: class IV adenylate cyclase [Flavisolibacter sp.]
MPLTVEFKARSHDNAALEKLLAPLHPEFAGEDHQVDTYFRVNDGRLKLREGLIENALIHYRRSDAASAKTSHVTLYQHNPDGHLKNVLAQALGVLVVVSKRRRIFFSGNVKIHFDNVEGLGSFVEVEAIDRDGSFSEQQLQEQCNRFIGLFSISTADFVAGSYSDMLLAKKSSTA